MKQNRPASLKGTPTSKRLLKYVTTDFKLPTLLVVLCIIISAAAGVAGSMFLQILIDDYITPLIGSQGQGFNELFKALIIMGGIYYIGVVSTYIYGRTMAIIGQGVQKEIRNSMFRKMQDLPIKYFDQNSFGDIMSRYTNDVDTLRQMLSQSLPQLINCVVSCTFIFFAMLYTSPLLTLVVACILAIQLVITKKISSHSSSWYEKLQNSIGIINGYTEEMLAGQKVVKVFCHEEQAMSGFNELNEELYFNATWSARYSNILMPIMNNFANIQYVVLALIGGALTVSAISPISLGALVAFLQLSKSFSMPIGQVSQQLSSIVMAMAGAQRIFVLMDEEPEVDNGYVTLVNVRYEDDGKVVEVKEQNEQWAWKHPHSDGSVSYTPLNDVYGAWRAMEELYEEGKIRAIGLANFYPDRLIDLAAFNKITPAVNQIEVNPFFQRAEDQKVMLEKGVQMEGCAPFAEGKNDLFKNELLQTIGDQYGKSIAQVILRWHIQRGIVAIPKSANVDRMQQNFDVFDFQLSEADMQKIATLDQNQSSFFDHRDAAAVERLVGMVRNTN